MSKLNLRQARDKAGVSVEFARDGTGGVENDDRGESRALEEPL